MFGVSISLGGRVHLLQSNARESFTPYIRGIQQMIVPVAHKEESGAGGTVDLSPSLALVLLRTFLTLWRSFLRSSVD